jgi:hypothetical protein
VSHDDYVADPGRRLTGTDVDAETSAVAGAILSFARAGVTRSEL